MFFEVDTSNLPLFDISLYDIDNIVSFNEFTEFWEQIHSKNKKYYFLFDTKDMSTPSPNYCMKMANFIKKLKKQNVNPLVFSVICIKTAIIRQMASFIFKITPPMSPVYIVKNREAGLQVYNDLIEGKKVSCKVILPKKYNNNLPSLAQ